MVYGFANVTRSTSGFNFIPSGGVLLYLDAVLIHSYVWCRKKASQDKQ